MARYTGPKVKRERRIGESLGLKGKISKRIETPPGPQTKRRKRISEFGRQLNEKQKLKFTYDVSEKQLRNYYQKAAKSRENTGEKLLQLLEQRLDNIVFRLGLAPTRAAARQLIVHGHVLVNNKKASFPSYAVEPNDVINLDQKALEMPLVQESLKEKKEVPSWLKIKGPVGQMTTIPSRDQIPLSLQEQLVIEYYSR